MAQVTKQAFTFVFDRATGKPVWPIEERAVLQSKVPGERTAATQPFPTKPAPFDRQGTTTEGLIDFTPQIKAEAPPRAGARPGGGFPGGMPRFSSGSEGPARPSIGPQGLPLIKPPWGRITAIDLNSGDHVWMIANGDAPDAVKNHPLMKGIDLKNAGKPERSPLLVTKTLLFGADGPGLFNAGPGAGGKILRAIDKKTGAIIHELSLPASTTGVPMTYMANDKQCIVVTTGARGVPAELVALAVT